MAETTDPIGSGVGHVIRDLKWSLIASLAGVEAFNAIDNYNKTGVLDIDPIPESLAGIISRPIGEAERLIGQPLFELLVAAPTGVDFSRAPGSQEGIAVSMVERLLGFAVMLPYGISKIKALLVAVMGENASKALVESLEKIPEEIGINWALGTMLESILEVAAKAPIEEKIAEQTRPARLEWPQLRALARQHIIPDEQLQERLAKAGFRDEDISLIKDIDRQRLSISDLQAAWAYGLLTEVQIRNYLDMLGIVEDDQDLVWELYMRRSQTTGGDQLRAVAQREYLAGHLTEDQYRQLLAQANVPSQSIDLEVQAANLVKQYGRTNLSVADVKKLRQDGVIDDRQARDRLMGLGYVEDDAAALVKEWTLEQTQSKPGLNESRILAYLKAGILTKSEAYDKLTGLGIRSDDAHFLVDHPEAVAGTKAKGSSDTDIVAAYRDDILDQDAALSKLVDTGLTTDAAQLKLRIANVAKNRGPKPKKAVKHLSEGQAIEAFKQGLVSDAWLQRELESIGYSHADAELIVVTEETKLSGNVPSGWVQLT